MAKSQWKTDPAGIYLLKVNSRNTRTRCEICSKLTIKTSDLVSLFLTLNILITPCSSISTVNFEQEDASWGFCKLVLREIFLHLLFSVFSLLLCFQSSY